MGKTTISHTTEEGVSFHYVEDDSTGETQINAGFRSADGRINATTENGGNVNGISCGTILALATGALIASGACGYLMHLASNPPN